MTTSLVNTLNTFATYPTQYSLEMKQGAPVLKEINYVTKIALKFKSDPFPAVIHYLRENRDTIDQAFTKEMKSSDLFWEIIKKQVNDHNKKSSIHLSLTTVSILSFPSDIPSDIFVHVFNFYAEPTLNLVCKRFDEMVKKSCVRFCRYLEEEAQGHLKKIFIKNKQILFKRKISTWSDELQAFILIQQLHRNLVSEIKKLDETTTISEIEKPPAIFEETLELGKIHPLRFKRLAQWIEDKSLVNFTQSFIHTPIENGSLTEQAAAIRKFLQTDSDNCKRTSLILSNQDLILIPPEIKYFKELKKLDLSYNKKLDKNGFPEEIEELNKLEEINITHTSLIKIPSRLSKSNAHIKIGRISS